MRHSKALGNTLLLVTAMVWGMAFVFQRKGMDHIGPLTFNAVRQVLASLALFVMVLASDAYNKAKGTLPSRTMTAEHFRLYKKNTLEGGIVLGVIVTLAGEFQQIGIVSTSAGKAGFITALYVVLVPVASFLFFRKYTGVLQVAAVVIATVGLYLLSVKEGFSIEKGDIWIMACAVFWTIYILACDRYSPVADTIRMSFIQFVCAAVLQIVIAMALEGPASSGWQGWGYYGQSLREAMTAIAYCGLVSSGIGFTGQIVGQKYTDAVSASLIMCLESVFAAIFGVLILREMMSGRELAGCVIMFAAIILSQLPSPRRKANMGMPKA